MDVSVGDGPSDIRLAGEVDLSSVAQLEEALAAAAVTREPVTIDLAGVTFIDSTGLHAIVRFALSSNGQGPVVLRNPPPMAVRLLEIVGVSSMPEIEMRHDA